MQNSDFQLFLASVELANFKSFSGHLDSEHQSQIVGPFTELTGILGPNGVGKSNIFDAIAFALNLNLQPGKVRHVRDLAHRPLAHGDEPFAKDSEQPNQEFHVKLNFLKVSGDRVEKLSIHRGLAKTDETGNMNNQYIVNENRQRPLLYDEYRRFLSEAYHMPNQQHFFIYQHHLDEIFGIASGSRLVSLFDELSGSAEFRGDYDKLETEIRGHEDLLKAVSEQLKELRHERVKLKGLTEFQRQIDDCIADQRSLESILIAMNIMQALGHCSDIDEEMGSLKQQLEKAGADRINLLDQLKSGELGHRKLRGELATKRQDHSELATRLSAERQERMAVVQQVENGRRVLKAKEDMLKNVQVEIHKRDQRREHVERAIVDAEAELTTLLNVQGSPETKDAYFQLRADMQANNAASERERSQLLAYAEGTLRQKRQTAESLVNIQRRRLAQVELSSHQAEAEVTKVSKQLANSTSDIARAEQAVETAAQAAKSSHDALHKIETELLEQEYQQREMELEKQMKAQDAKLAQTLEELKRRCRGYLGQFYELLNPISRKYELACKVSLLPCLRYLVVDTAASAKYTTEFLKEKGLQKHILVLENLPVVRPESLAQKVKELGGEALGDVVDVAPGHKLVAFRKAVDFYTQNKVVCTDFSQAIRLQREAGCRNIVTLDGSEFKSGQISGGCHTGLGAMNLGQAQVEQELRQVQGQVTKLAAQREKAFAAQYEDKRRQQQAERELAQIKQEIELARSSEDKLRQRVTDFANELELVRKQVTEHERQLREVEIAMDQSEQKVRQIDDAMKSKNKEAIDRFCGEHGFDDLAAFEESLGIKADIIERKNRLEGELKQLRNELVDLKQKTLPEMQAKSIEASLDQERTKLSALEAGLKQAESAKMQERLQQLAEEVERLEKETSDVQRQQQSLRDEIALQAARAGNLQRNIGVNKVQAANLRNQIRTKIEEAVLERAPLVDAVSLTDESSQQPDMPQKLVNYLSDQPLFLQFAAIDQGRMAEHLLEGESGTERVRVGRLKELESIAYRLREKLNALQRQEDDFNQSVQVVVESDEAQMRLAEQITECRGKLDERAKDLDRAKQELATVSRKRRDLFLTLFDATATKLADVYVKLTSISEQRGSASLTLMNRDTPFAQASEENSQPDVSNILFDFKPPQKQYDFDIDARSGGEKAMASLALVFALAMTVKPRPHLLLLDEVDAHLDADNANLLQQFLKDHQRSLPQTLLISHKEQTMACCDSLIGVTQQEYYRLKDGDASGGKFLSACTFALDLREFK